MHGPGALYLVCQFANQTSVMYTYTCKKQLCSTATMTDKLKPVAIAVADRVQLP